MNEARSKLRHIAWALCLLGTAMLTNCGGDDSSGGDSKDCKLNDTRQCVGPAACAGGQICGADGTWGACDCSGTGGNSGANTGGNGGSDASAGSGGSAAGASGGASGGGGDGGPADSGPGGSPNCPQGKGPVMIDVGPFCIDSTEVTQKQYKDFLDTVTGPDPKWPACSTIPTVVHSAEACFTQPDHPVVCVNWCAANAYCAWAGKRLCGKVGGGALPPANFGIPWENEWGYACTQGAKTKYPWGDQPAANCNTDNCAPATCSGAVTSMPSCRGVQTPYDLIFDQIGNVAEWINSCDSNSCWTGGGAGSEAQVDCTTTPKNTINMSFTTVKTVGIRCCADHLEVG
ncbi:MAG: SUMF1/EgtB/PvdO family nonheme iron enzyme [Polyangiaceae bacterium]